MQRENDIAKVCQVLELQSLMDNLSEDVRADFLSGTNGAVVSRVNLFKTDKPWLVGTGLNDPDHQESGESKKLIWVSLSPVKALLFYSKALIIQTHWVNKLDNSESG